MGRVPASAQQPSLGVRGLRPVAAGFRALGYDPEPFFAAAGLDLAILGDPDARVPAAAVMSMLADAARATGDSSLGLHLAERADIASFDIHAYAMLSSPTFGAACERLCRYQRLIHDTTRVGLEVDPPVAALRHVLPGGAAIPRHSAEFVLTSWLRVGRLATGSDWSPVEVRFAHERPSDTDEIERFFRAPLRFAAENALRFDAALLDAPCVGADAGLLEVLDRHANDVLKRIPLRRSLADDVRVATLEELRGGVPRVEAVARRLHMSVRTLNRALAEEGATFSRVLDQVRHELAIRHLGEQQLAIGEVAFLLGFSELSSFYRAFKRWTGMTPAAYRAQRPS